MFLNPLLLHSLTGEPYHHALRSSIEGIAPSELKRRLPFRRRLRKDVLIHVIAQAWMGNRFSGDTAALKSVANQQVPLKTLHKCWKKQPGISSIIHAAYHLSEKGL